MQYDLLSYQDSRQNCEKLVRVYSPMATEASTKAQSRGQSRRKALCRDTWLSPKLSSDYKVEPLHHGPPHQIHCERKVMSSFQRQQQLSIDLERILGLNYSQALSNYFKESQALAD